MMGNDPKRNDATSNCVGANTLPVRSSSSSCPPGPHRRVANGNNGVNVIDANVDDDANEEDRFDDDRTSGSY